MHGAMPPCSVCSDSLRRFWEEAFDNCSIIGVESAGTARVLHRTMALAVGYLYMLTLPQGDGGGTGTSLQTKGRCT